MSRNRTASPAPATDATPEVTPDVTPDVTPAPATDGPTFPDIITPAVLIDLGPDAVVAAYATASPGTKAKVRNVITDGMGDAVRTGDFPAATALAAIDKMIKDRAATKSTKAPVDYTKITKDRVATLLMAAHAIMTGDVPPADFPADGDLPAIFDDVDAAMIFGHVAKITDGAYEDLRPAATRLAGAKVNVATRAAMRSVRDHLAGVRDAVTTDDGAPVYVRVAKIAKTTTDAYGTDHPSSGAVAARLFGDKGPDVPGVDAVRKGDTLPDGTVAPADGAIFYAVN